MQILFYEGIYTLYLLMVSDVHRMPLNRAVILFLEVKYCRCKLVIVSERRSVN